MDLGELGEQTANIYFVPISPLADANSNLECEIEYWTLGDGTVNEQLLELVREIKSYEIDFQHIKYTFEFDTDEVIVEEREYASYSFDFTNWNPDRNAYVVRPKYEVPAEYARISTSQSNTSKEEFIESFSDSLVNELYEKHLDLFSETIAQEVLVEGYEVDTPENFAFAVNFNGTVEEEERTYFENLLRDVEVNDLLGSKYKYTNTKRIGITYTVTNQLNEYAESVTRYFNVR